MSFILAILGWFGGGPLKTIADALTKAHSDTINGVTEQERIAAGERVSTLTQALADMQNARASARNMPWWMAAIACFIGFPFALHVFLVGMGTSFQPLIIQGPMNFLFWSWDLSWLLKIPKWPAPYDQAEIGIIGFFYGFAAVAVSGNSIASAIIKRKK